MKQLDSAPTHQIPPFKAAASIPLPCIATAVPTIHIPTQQQDGEPAVAGGTAAADGITHHISRMISRAALYFCDVLTLLSSLFVLPDTTGGCGACSCRRSSSSSRCLPLLNTASKHTCVLCCHCCVVITSAAATAVLMVTLADTTGGCGTCSRRWSSSSRWRCSGGSRGGGTAKARAGHQVIRSSKGGGINQLSNVAPVANLRL